MQMHSQPHFWSTAAKGAVIVPLKLSTTKTPAGGNKSIKSINTVTNFALVLRGAREFGHINFDDGL